MLSSSKTARGPQKKYPRDRRRNGVRGKGFARDQKARTGKKVLDDLFQKKLTPV